MNKVSFESYFKKEFISGSVLKINLDIMVLFSLRLRDDEKIIVDSNEYDYEKTTDDK
ncbi:hypothetical protein KHQ81_04920 [Mycoplasmatota bacterium]|nr:hypothetical protein KHQ81_04920 [Mycoplasmatota bacterium]